MSFEYNSEPIEVFIVTNDEGMVNGYAEVSVVCQMLSPYTRLNVSQLWNATPTSYKIQNNGKNYVHAIVICKYLASVSESDSQSYKNLRQLVRDLMVGDQKDDNDALEEIKNNLHDIKHTLTQKDDQSNLLSDMNALLRIFKTEIINELKPEPEVVTDLI
ncbi:PxORF53 peptide [Plutella xylostella granulovirus]|jgi:CII-binding regulator of phage lambda lysogenization HflD|uniref:ORF51 protein n=1 Tax=Plutella xylostella granulovirus TaxID=98383 RepID=Q9DVY0_9BBAC|nr:PxORF53 peptide [Plutella xylostella granulovirus]AAG27351.1 PxORF53 peptide [Plutella xylostella granulovirus]AMQ35663.1 PxGV-Corf51 protein [Plutella xylostella granulovirus]AMQ35780.1 PxGV-Korf51 protein [Plutella xylostella granulovirus]AMQ35897.1 PxGV-Morf51 protein [Plutella xylostella granulovirus]AMQ36014.1 PxGV-Torf51 protein [Plutella xylostella granulovirus]